MSFRIKPEIIFLLEKSPHSQGEEDNLYPPLDMYYSGDSLHLEIEMPGMDPQDVQLTLRGKELIIEGSKKDWDSPPSPFTFLRMERFMGPFRRTIQLPHSVDSQGAKATFRKGVLYIQIPIKREKYNVKIEQED